MNHIIKKAFLLTIFSCVAFFCKAQLVITDQSSALALAQRMVGDGVSISNVTFTGNSLMAGYFKNLSGGSPDIDSGIVLTSGRAKTQGIDNGMDGNGSTISANVLASEDWSLPGDLNLANAIGAPLAQMNDACVLEFDFVPLGDSVKFRYSFSSEEYDPLFACSEFIDAFAFFISGPGITGLQNIALVPNTTMPVSIENINNVLGILPAGCPMNPAYYQDNSTNTFFTHEGLTVVLTALARVQPCQTYHLKLVIADNTDGLYDSGVFLEAKSLTSNSFQLTNLTQVDNTTGRSYLVEGCAVGALKIQRQASTLFSQTVNLGYGGTVLNSIDVQTLPSSITIPANQTEALLNIFPLIDNTLEGIETLKIYTLAPCGVATPTDSAEIEIRDFDTLGITPDTALICVGGSIQLNATNGYTTYQWDANPGLNNANIQNPIVTPIADSTMFYCTATVGTCNGRDSVFIYWTRLNLVSKADVNCRGASTGQIIVDAGPEWLAPVEYSINGSAYQSTGTFNNLPIGTYTIKARNPASCVDSIVVNIVQAFPDLLVNNTVATDATCSGNPDGTITITVGGGKLPYQYSLDATNFQNSNAFNVNPGTYTVTVKDANNCIATRTGIVVLLNNSVTLSTGAAPTICEGKNAALPATTNATSVLWSPSASLSNATALNPIASPIVTTKYIIIATTGICTRKDSVIVNVNAAPIPNAGKDSTICFGASTQLFGSGGIDFKWEPATYLSSDIVKDPFVTKPVTITYYLTVTDGNGCTSLTRDDVVVTVPPPAKLFAGADTAIAINQPLQLFAIDVNNTGFINYSWTPSGGLNNAFIKNPVAILTDATTYLIVTASTASNCIGIDTIRVKTYKGPEIYVANSFTPNGDGLNDVLRAFPVGIKTFSYFRIYNRYGQMVFATTNENLGWNGKLKGAMQSMNTFVWIAEGIDYKGNTIQRKGTTTIIQ